MDIPGAHKPRPIRIRSIMLAMQQEVKAEHDRSAASVAHLIPRWALIEATARGVLADKKASQRDKLRASELLATMESRRIDQQSLQFDMAYKLAKLEQDDPPNNQNVVITLNIGGNDGDGE